MKKTLIGGLQVLSYFVIYEIVVFAIYSLFGLLINVINRIPILKIIITDLCAETLMFTICPLVSSVIIVLAMGFLFKKTGIYLDEPVPFQDDAMAALRYGIEPWRKKKRVFL